MEPLFPIIMIIGVGIAIGSAYFGADNWKAVAAELGLNYSHGFQRSMTGNYDGFRVKISAAKHHIDIQVWGDGFIRDTISLSKEGFLSGILGGRDIEIGCPSFDNYAYVSSFSRKADAEVSALLDDKTRALVLRVVVRGGAKVSAGNITHQQSAVIGAAPKVIKDLIELGRHLSMKTKEIPGRLANNALKGRISSVRLHNLSLLQQEYSDRPEAAETSAALLTDPHHSIRLAAAMFLGEEGLSVVQEIALSRRVIADVRIKALEHLVSKAKREDMIEISKVLLLDRSGRLQRMAIRSLGLLMHEPSLETITALLNREDVETSLVIIKAMENIQDSSAEAALIGLLENSPNRVTTAAIEALAKLGTVRAVEPLHPLTKRMRFKRSAREAIASIQSRLGDVESGRLSLAPAVDPVGALSLADDPEKAGGLSLDEGSA